MLRVTQRGRGECVVTRATVWKMLEPEGREKVGCDCEDGDEWREWQGYLGVESTLNFFRLTIISCILYPYIREQGKKEKEEKEERIEWIRSTMSRSCDFFGDEKLIWNLISDVNLLKEIEGVIVAKRTRPITRKGNNYKLDRGQFL